MDIHDLTRWRAAGTDGGRDIGILAFRIGPYCLGVNLFKVREITGNLPVRAVPYAHPLVLGVIELRGKLAPAVNLAAWLGVEYTEKPQQKTKMIIAEYLGLMVGFPVDAIDGILRLGWKDIEPPGKLERYAEDILGVIRNENRLISLIDYEHIIMEINPDTVFSESHGARGSKKLTQLRAEQFIWILEDSKTVRDFFRSHLSEQGYSNIMFFENGAHALESLEVVKRRPMNGAPGGEWPGLIISDIEMPVMDGYTFIKTIKSDDALKRIPVILFSSLLTAGSKLKGEMAEADAQLSKSESAGLIRVMDRLIFR